MVLFSVFGARQFSCVGRLTDFCELSLFMNHLQNWIEHLNCTRVHCLSTCFADVNPDKT